MHAAFKYSFLIFYGILFFNARSSSQSKDLKFENFDTRKGLENIYVNNFVRDSSGYIWISGNGISRYDGIQLKTYLKNEKNPNSLREDYTDNLVVDKNGTLWIGSAGGICYYNKSIDGFTFIDRSPSGKITYAYSFAYDGKETIWFSCNFGLCSINISTKKISETSLKKYSNPHWAIIDSSGKIWVGTHFEGLFLYDPSKNSFKNFLFYNKSKITSVTFLKSDNQNNIWLSKSRGILKINPDDLTDKNGHLKFEELVELQNISASAFTFLPAYTGDSILWIATSGDGLIAFNVITKKITAQFLPDKNDPYSILSNTLTTLYADYEDHLWIPGLKGISMININSQNFKSRKITELNDGPDPYLWTIVADKNEKNIVWIGTNRQGILKYDWLQKKVLKWTKNFESTIIEGNNAHTIADDGNGNLWIGSGNTLYQYKKQAGRFLKYQALPTENKFAYRTTINKIICLHDTVLIAATTGLIAFLPKKNQYKIIYTKNNGGTVVNSFIFSLKQDDEGIIWCSTAEGLLKIDLVRSTDTTYLFNTNKNFIAFNYFTDLDLDRNNIVLASGSGIVLFNKVSGKFSRLHPNEDLFYQCQSIMVDTLHNYWINTNHGLALYNQQKKIYKTFTMMDGLQENVSIAPIDMVNNIMICKYREAFTYFNPYAVEKNTNIPQPVISTFKIFEKPVLFDPIRIEKERFNLTYKQNFITFEFNAFEFNYPDKIQFAYRLTGFDKDWIFNGNKRSATYTNLPGGNYSFEMKAANSAGLWSKPAVFKIYIKPAFWQTLWFKILIAIILAAIIYSFFRQRINKIRNEEGKKTAINKMMAEAEMKALRAQMNPHFIFNCMATVDGFILQNKKLEASAFLNKFSRLIREVLENSQYSLIPVEKDLKTVILYIELEEIRHQHKFSHSLTMDDEIINGHYKIPPLLLQPYIENAILHGLRHKLTGDGKLSIELTIKDGMLLCIIKDNGIGIIRSSEINRQSRKEHTSLGTKVTNTRIETINAVYENKTRVQTINAVDHSGTIVTISLPLIE